MPRRFPIKRDAVDSSNVPSERVEGIVERGAMEKVVRIFSGHDEADAEEDVRSTPERRIDTVLELQSWMNPDAAEHRFERVYRITQTRTKLNT